jgi:hypothetical protein
MAKSKRVAAPVESDDVQAPAAPPKAGVGIIQVNSEYPGHKHRGARGEFWQLLEQYDGRPVAEMAAEFASQPPKIQRGSVAYGSFIQWLNWFVKQGGCKIVK